MQNLYMIHEKFYEKENYINEPMCRAGWDSEKLIPFDFILIFTYIK